jgi:hypothetical protein
MKSDHDTELNDSARNGKIARLPRALRDQLNLRLDDGQPADAILAWLNADPAVKAMLAGGFGGSPINAQNLTNWRQGGYQQWLKYQERAQLARDFLDDAAELSQKMETGELTKHLSTMLLAELALVIRDEVPRLTDPTERATRVMGYLAVVTRIRHEEYLLRKLEVDHARSELMLETKILRTMAAKKSAGQPAPTTNSSPSASPDASSPKIDPALDEVFARAVSLAGSNQGKSSPIKLPPTQLTREQMLAVLQPGSR